MLKKISIIYFSPTGGTKRVASYLAKSLAENIHEIDLSLYNAGEYTFTADDIILFAMPVFGGRIPNFAIEKLKTFHGNQSTAITAVVYGNRAYEDSLLELNDCLEVQGFRVQASIASIAEHSMCRNIAKGRPDEQDELQLKEYAEAILKKLLDVNSDTAIGVPGNRPYKDWTPLPTTPLVLDTCIKCGICAEQCPTGAIPKNAPETTEPSKCILCMCCVSVCPHQSRMLPAQIHGMLAQKLAPLENIRHENELFL